MATHNKHESEEQVNEKDHTAIDGWVSSINKG